MAVLAVWVRASILVLLLVETDVNASGGDKCGFVWRRCAM